ncbi:MAG TPA: sigma-70 family RNA polymerase sigma factor, partial [Solirubrobacteraceae bacterium]|nr:sigma-70 family RNA polymerase sigma factor [Solirubrobacteraceae bacterium]
MAATRLRRCTDDQLVERFRAGRDEAFQVIHDRYRARLLAYVRQMLDGRAGVDAEDVLQDVFERAARTLRAERTPLGLRPWLYSVAHNRCVDELRRRPPASPDVIAASRLPAGDTSAVAERRAEVERLFRDLRALPELQRSALLMRELQGLSHAELAQALDASVPAVKSLLVRARVGLVDAAEARGVPCATIRDDLASSYDRRVKASAQAARHLRECTACRSYRAELRRTSRRIAALIPGPTILPLAAIGRLLGGAGLHAEAPATVSSV